MGRWLGEIEVPDYFEKEKKYGFGFLFKMIVL